MKKNDIHEYVKQDKSFTVSVSETEAEEIRGLIERGLLNSNHIISIIDKKDKKMKTMIIKNAISVRQKNDVNGNPVYLVTGFDMTNLAVAFYTKSYVLDPYNISSYECLEITEPKHKRGKLWSEIVGVEK